LFFGLGQILRWQRLLAQTLKRLKRLLVENQPSRANKKKEGKRMSERYRKYGKCASSAQE